LPIPGLSRLGDVSGEPLAERGSRALAGRAELWPAGWPRLVAEDRRAACRLPGRPGSAYFPAGGRGRDRSRTGAAARQIAARGRRPADRHSTDPPPPRTGADNRSARGTGGCIRTRPYRNAPFRL